MNTGEINLKELLDLRLIFSVLMIIVGVSDIAHVSSYVRNYGGMIQEGERNQITPDIQLPDGELEKLGIKPTFTNLGSTNTGYYELSQVQFFNAIFMLCSGFFVTLWGCFKFWLWFERKEVNKKLEEIKKSETVRVR